MKIAKATTTPCDGQQQDVPVIYQQCEVLCTEGGDLGSSWIWALASVLILIGIIIGGLSVWYYRQKKRKTEEEEMMMLTL